MKRRICFLLATVIALGFGVLPLARCQDKEDPAHEELRGLMKEVLKDYNAGDLDKMLAVFEPDAVVTWPNAQVTKGPKEIKAFYEKMTKGPNRVVEKSTIKPVPDEIAVLYNDGKTAVAWGNSKDYYLLTDGMEFNQDTRWSATVIKKDGKWKVASVHISVNVFDNPVLNLAIKKTSMWVGGAGAGAGALLGLIVGVLVGRSRAKTPPMGQTPV